MVCDRDTVRSLKGQAQLWGSLPFKLLAMAAERGLLDGVPRSLNTLPAFVSGQVSKQFGRSNEDARLGVSRFNLFEGHGVLAVRNDVVHAMLQLNTPGEGGDAIKTLLAEHAASEKRGARGEGGLTNPCPVKFDERVASLVRWLYVEKEMIEPCDECWCTKMDGFGKFSSGFPKGDAPSARCWGRLVPADMITALKENDVDVPSGAIEATQGGKLHMEQQAATTRAQIKALEKQVLGLSKKCVTALLTQVCSRAPEEMKKPQLVLSALTCGCAA